MAGLSFVKRKGLSVATIGRGSLDPRFFSFLELTTSRELFLMQRVALGLLLLALGLIPGCGGGAISEPSKFASAPHGGSIVDLPESLGFVELKTETEPVAKGSRKTSKSRIVAYFIQPDATTPMSPPPTDVKVTLGAGGSGAVVNLLPQPSDPGQFASEPGDYPDGLRGQIDFQLDGKPVQATFLFR